MAHEQAIAITRNFAARLLEIRALLDTDIKTVYEGDPFARRPDEVWIPPIPW